MTLRHQAERHPALSALLPALARAELTGVDLKEERSGPGAVAFGTMHRAKGLEFRAVAVVGCDADALPAQSALGKLTDPADR